LERDPAVGVEVLGFPSTQTDSQPYPGRRLLGSDPDLG
jgi:hypothetical protein